MTPEQERSRNERKGWHPDWSAKSRGPEGRGLCKFCLTEVPKGRRTWCSDKCVEAWQIEHDWAAIRLLVFERDRGVCHECGLDCKALKLAWWPGCWTQYQLVTYPEPHHEWRTIRSRFNFARPGPGRELRAELTEQGFHNMNRDLWEAHHVVARADGGSNHPDNLVTLCLRCHKAHTARQARDRADRRTEARGQKLLFTIEESV